MAKNRGAMMPVDPYGRIIPVDPADRYAVPINRKPKRRPRLTLLNGCLGVIALCMALLAFSGLHAWSVQQASENVNTSTPVRHDDWPTLATFTGGDMDATTKPIVVSGTWQISWHCGNADIIHIEVFDEKGNDVWLQQVSCLSGDTDGFADITYTGQVHIEIGSLGSWIISIKEP